MILYSNPTYTRIPIWDKASALPLWTFWTTTILKHNIKNCKINLKAIFSTKRYFVFKIHSVSNFSQFIITKSGFREYRNWGANHPMCSVEVCAHIKLRVTASQFLVILDFFHYRGADMTNGDDNLTNWFKAINQMLCIIWNKCIAARLASRLGLFLK